MSASLNPIARLRDISIRHSYNMALAGAIGAVCGLYLYVELVKTISDTDLHNVLAYLETLK